MAAIVLEGAPAEVHVDRGGRRGLVALAGGVLVVAVLAYLPYLVFQSTTNLLVDFFVLVTLATMWNLLAGYAGLVSIGQQAYLGIGAYAVFVLADLGLDPYVAVPLAVAVAAAFSLPTSVLAFRLRGDYFAIATWVIAEVYRLFFIRQESLGGGSGTSVPGLTLLDYTKAERGAYTYWLALAVAVLAIGGAYLLLRSRTGLALTAMRDDETGARSVGVRVGRAKRLVYLVAAAGAGAAGAVIAIHDINIQPTNVFSVQWSAYMIFAVVIGGLGTMEGPIIGSAVFFVLQHNLAQYGAWYLIILGLVAGAVSVWTPAGLWGLVRDRWHFHLFPTGYRLAPGSPRRDSDRQGHPAPEEAQPGVPGQSGGRARAWPRRGRGSEPGI